MLYVLEKIASSEAGQSANFHPCQPYEANLDFEIRFMADLGLVGCGWAECEAGKYEHIETMKKQLNCQIEVMKEFELVRVSEGNV